MVMNTTIPKPANSITMINDEYSCNTISARWYQPVKRLTIVANTIKTPRGRPIEVLLRNCFFRCRWFDQYCMKFSSSFVSMIKKTRLSQRVWGTEQTRTVVAAFAELSLTPRPRYQFISNLVFRISNSKPKLKTPNCLSGCENRYFWTPNKTTFVP